MTKLEFIDETNQRFDIEIVRPHQAIAFDPEEFTLLIAYALEVGQGPDTVLNQARDDIFVEGKLMAPGMQRIFGAVELRFRGDKLKSGSFMHRYFAFMGLLKSGVLGEPFVTKSGKGKNASYEISDDVIKLLASFPLKDEGSVDPKAFIAELRKRVADEEGTSK